MNKALYILLAAFALLGAASSRAQWPERPIQLIVPFPPGGVNDIVARKFAASLATHIKQSVVVLNRAGASGTIGTSAVASSTDGYTLGFIPNGPLTVQPSLNRNVRYSLNNLTPICQIFTYSNAIVVRPDSGIKNLQDFLKASKAAAKGKSVGHEGVGTAAHFGMLQLAQATGAKFLGVPFRGAPPVAFALKSGEIEAGILAADVAQPHNFRALAVTSEKRLAIFPDVPTLREEGIDVIAKTYAGVLGPANMSPEALKVLEGACSQVARSPDFKDALKAMNIEPQYLDRERYETTLRADTVLKRRLIESSGIRTE